MRTRDILEVQSLTGKAGSLVQCPSAHWSELYLPLSSPTSILGGRPSKLLQFSGLLAQCKLRFLPPRVMTNCISIQCASVDIGMLVVGRVIAGVCVGIASSICPVYQAEIAPKEIRGRVVSLQQWAITWGILIQYFIQYGASWVDGGPNNPGQSTAAFRIPWGVQIVPAVILFFGMYYLPRSPRWLASKDRWEEAIQVMAALHGGGDVNNPKVLAEYQEIEEALRFEREEAISSYKQLTEPRMLKRVLLGMSIQMWSQLCGMNVMMYYVVCKSYVLYLQCLHLHKKISWRAQTLRLHS